MVCDDAVAETGHPHQPHPPSLLPQAVDGEDVDVPTAFEGLLINNTFTKLTWASLQVT